MRSTSTWRTRCLEQAGVTAAWAHVRRLCQRMERDLEALLALPAVPYDVSDKLREPCPLLCSLAMYRTVDYSVPVAYGHMQVLVRGYVGEAVISCPAEVIARQPGSHRIAKSFVFYHIHHLPQGGAHYGIAEPGCSAGRVQVAGGVRRAAAAAGVEDGQALASGSSCRCCG